MRQSIAIILLFFLWASSLYSIPPLKLKKRTLADSGIQESKKMLEKADNFYFERKYPEAIKTYDLILKKETTVKAPVLKKIALSHAALEHVDECVHFLEQSLMSEFDTKILMDGRFDTVRNTEAFSELEEKYVPSFNIWSYMYLYVALIGFYISIIINLNKKIDFIARTLISVFIFIHSFFIFHICISITNYEYEFPHSYLMSTSFSFLYGPLLYFYFKRITQQYQFRKKDLLHLLPTVLFIIYLIPIYTLSANEKLVLLLEDFNDGFSFSNLVITGTKLTSLVVYGYFIRKLYLKSKKSEIGKANKIWQKNLYRIHFFYILSYLLYCIFISNNIPLFHSQIICMAVMVLYIGYSASVQPAVFSGLYSYHHPLFFKYEKSGLTESLSKELMQNLINLFDSEKIYKENDICLEMIAQRLNTTRHNASQVINEHFNMNFHELVNKYRIREAKSILNQDSKKNLNIIDVAYEVGYNNKVTFNKAFKKDTSLTPSEYQKASTNS